MTTPVEVTRPSLSPIIITAKDMQATTINTNRNNSNINDNRLAKKYHNIICDINDAANGGSISMFHPSPEMQSFYEELGKIRFSESSTTTNGNVTTKVTLKITFHFSGNQTEKNIIERKTTITDVTTVTIQQNGQPLSNTVTSSVVVEISVPLSQIEYITKSSEVIANSYSKESWLNLRDIVKKARATKEEKQEFLIGQGFAVENTPIYNATNNNSGDDPFAVDINWKQPETELNPLIKEAEDSHKDAVTYRDNRTAEKFAYNFTQLNKAASLGGRSYNWGHVTPQNKDELSEYFNRHEYNATFQQATEGRTIQNNVTLNAQNRRVIFHTMSEGDVVSGIRITSTGTHTPFNPSMIDIYIAPTDVAYTSPPSSENVIETDLSIPFNSFVDISQESLPTVSAGDRLVIYSSTDDVLTVKLDIVEFAGYNLNVVWDPLPK